MAETKPHSEEFLNSVIRAIASTPIGVPMEVHSGLSVSPFMSDIINRCQKQGWEVTGAESVSDIRVTQFTLQPTDLTPPNPTR